MGLPLFGPASHRDSFSRRRVVGERLRLGAEIGRVVHPLGQRYLIAFQNYCCEAVFGAGVS